MKKLISLVIPVLNEEGNLAKLCREITKNIPRNFDYELIFVDDGSSDSSLRIIKRLAKNNPKIKAVSFYKNFGKSAAYMAGFKFAQGEIIITMDADLQDDSAEIKKFLEKLKHFDLVIGWKKRRLDPPAKILASRFFNLIVGKTVGLKLHDIDCGFRAMRISVAQSLNLYGTLYRFIPLFAQKNGFKIAEIEVKHQPRRAGRSKFGAKRLLAGLFDFFTILFLTKYMERPMHFFGLWGLIMTFVGFAILIYLTIIKIFYGAVLSNRPIIFLGIILIIVGLQLFSLGLLGEFIQAKDKNKSRYLIKKRINLK